MSLSTLDTPSNKPWKTIAREKQDQRAALLTAAQVELNNFSSSIDYTGVTGRSHTLEECKT
jgi:hypothetical protein